MEFGYVLGQTVTPWEIGASEFCMTKDERTERTGLVPFKPDCRRSLGLRNVRTFPKNEEEGVEQPP